MNQLGKPIYEAGIAFESLKYHTKYIVIEALLMVKSWAHGSEKCKNNVLVSSGPLKYSGPRFRVSPLVMGDDFASSLCRIVSANGGPFTRFQVLHIYDDGSQIGMYVDERLFLVALWKFLSM